MQTLNFKEKLYAIADFETCQKYSITIDNFVKGYFTGGGKIVQYRDKLSKPDEIEKTVLNLINLVEKHKGYLIINDHYSIAEKYNLPFHIGQDTQNIKSRLPFGKSIHTLGELNHLMKEKAQPDYIGFGAMFPSKTKSEVSINLSLLPEVQKLWKKNIVLIGGISEKNVELLPHKNNIYYAVISDFFSKGNSIQQIEIYTKQFLNKLIQI